MHIDKNIKYLRKKNRFTQEQLAKRIDKTYITVGDYERGKVTPPLQVALQLCDIFHIDLNSLVTRNLEKESPAKLGSTAVPPPDYKAEYKALQKQYHTLERINHLQEQRLADLERMIKKHAPELAKEIGLK